MPLHRRRVDLYSDGAPAYAAHTPPPGHRTTHTRDGSRSGGGRGRRRRRSATTGRRCRRRGCVNRSKLPKPGADISKRNPSAPRRVAWRFLVLKWCGRPQAQAFAEMALLVREFMLGVRPAASARQAGAHAARQGRINHNPEHLKRSRDPSEDGPRCRDACIFNSKHGAPR